MRRRRIVIGATAAALLVAGGVAATAAATGGGDGAAADRRLPKATAEVTRGDLVDTRTVDGTLGYGEEQALMAGASGTVTWLPREGATVGRGKTLYGLNGEPVTLMYGDVPLYRPLSAGVSGGRDVEQLERNLDRLGYGDGMTVDDDFTSATADAVREWQDDRGLPETGMIDGSEVIFAPGAVRIVSHPTGVGGRSAAGKPVLRVTGTERLVRVQLDTADQQLARKGAGVRVELPGDETVPGRITEVGTVATAKNTGGQDTESPSAESTITVEITLDDPDKAGNLDQAPVSVHLESERRKDVLSVPVGALQALPGGGYGVQVVTGDSVRVVPVEPGLYAEGRVEISGQGITAGTKVGVPSR